MNATGNIKDFFRRGKRVIQTNHIGQTSWVASFLGWHRGDHIVGQGATKQDAIDDLGKRTGISIEDCLFDE